MTATAETAGRVSLAAALLLTLLLVGGGVAIKARCVTGEWGGGQEYRRLCYTELRALYEARGLDDDRLPYVEEPNEYPAGTGLTMYVTARLSGSPETFFAWNVFVLGACALVSTAALHRATGGGRGVLLFAAAPPLVLHAVQAWDLLAVVTVAVGFAAWRSRRFELAGAAFGVGVAMKLFPLAALAAGAAALVVRGDRRTAARVAGAAAATWAAINVPVAIADAGGWWATYEFHADRVPDFATPWYWLFHDRADYFGAFTTFVDVVAVAGLAAALAGVVVLLRRRAVGVAGAGALLVIAFLTVSKVHSPQYALWVLPFLAVLRPTRPLVAAWIAYVAADAVLFVSSFRWFEQWVGGAPEATGWQAVFAASTFARSAALLAIAAAVVAAGAGRDALEDAGAA